MDGGRDLLQEAHLQALALWVRLSGLVSSLALFAYASMLHPRGLGSLGVYVLLFIAALLLAAEVVLYPLGRALSRRSPTARLVVLGLSAPPLALAVAQVWQALPPLFQAWMTHDFSLYQRIWAAAWSLEWLLGTGVWAGMAWLALLSPRARRLFQPDYPSERVALPFSPLYLLPVLAAVAGAGLWSWSQVQVESSFHQAQGTVVDAGRARRELEEGARKALFEARADSCRLPFGLERAEVGDWCELEDKLSGKPGSPWAFPVVLRFEVTKVEDDALVLKRWNRRLDNGQALFGTNLVLSRSENPGFGQFFQERSFEAAVGVPGHLEPEMVSRLGLDCRRLSFTSRAGQAGSIWVSGQVKAGGVVAYELGNVTRLELSGYGSKDRVLWGKVGPAPR